jgi:LysM repeat protein
MKYIPRLFALLLALTLLSFTSLSDLSAEEGSAEEKVHIVQPGENLSTIAQRYGTTVSVLRQLNNLANANFVWSGQRLRLPETAAAVESPSDSRVEELVTITYIVKVGDTLASIAAEHRVSLAWMVEQNQVNPAQQLAVGRELVVPGRLHVVQAGENLSTIATRYQTTSAAIMRANNLVNANRLTVGQRLVIAPPSLNERVVMDLKTGPDGYHVHTVFPTTTEKWIDVSLSEQRVVAYEGTKPVRSFTVSTGLPSTPTVTGTFRIWAKTPIQDMYGGNRAAGTYYYLRGVQWVQYFYKDYAFHGTFWHTNFGRPASRGCINMSNEDAKWLYEWANPHHDGNGWFISDDEHPGTLVVVHQ